MCCGTVALEGGDQDQPAVQQAAAVSEGGFHMKSVLNPSDLNDAARLVMVAERCGSEILDDSELFDAVLGPGRFASLSPKVLNFARKCCPREK